MIDLTLSDLVQGLERQGDKYQALDVFAWQVRELRQALETRNFGELKLVDPLQPDRAWFAFQRDGKSYQVKVQESGVARLTRAAGALGLTGEQVALGALGAIVGASKELPGMILGFLVGAALGSAPDSPRHVLTLRYDEQERQWRAYDGPLAKWMREQALKSSPAQG
jgi:hypothetical protein